MAETIRIPLELAPLPNNFQGNPQAFAEAMVERMRVLFPTGYSTFIISDTEPESNQGPWIKGDQIFLWNEEEKRYLPLDISNVWQVAIQEKEPTDPATSPIWIQTNAAGTMVLGVSVYLNGKWVPVTNPRGPTADRPVNPPDYTRYFDTDIEVEIFYRRGIWRTMYGSPGDIKYVGHPTLAAALTANPGWVEFGGAMAIARGRVFVPAHKDHGVNPVASFPPLNGITARFATEYWGQEVEKLTTQQLPSHWHTPWADASVFLPGKGRSGGDGENFAIYKRDAEAENLISGATGAGEAHANMQPTIALWCLTKI